MTTKFKKSFSPMLICWNDIKIHLGFEDSYFVPPPTFTITIFSVEGEWGGVPCKDTNYEDTFDRTT